jgi:hypothetical protein
MCRTDPYHSARMARSWPLVSLALGVLLAGVTACDRRSSDEKPHSESAPGASQRVAAPAPPPPVIHYRRVPIPNAKVLFALRDSLGKPAFFEVLKVNRVDLGHVRARDTLVVPEGLREMPVVDTLRHSPFPLAVPALDSLPELLLISLRVQAFGAYAHGRLVRWGPVSTGRKEMPTPVGLYHVNWKDKERASTENEEWLLTWYMNLDNLSGLSLHQYNLPGYAASHSCIRLLEEDARWLYSWTEQWRLTPDSAAVLRNGTPVVIYGKYAYGRRRPWRRLPEDPSAVAIPLGEIEGALAAYRVIGASATARR